MLVDTISSLFFPFAAYQTTFNSRVIDVLSEWGSLYVILNDKVSRAHDVDDHYQIRMLSV